MAKISLLFSLAFVLALSSLFLTVSSQTSPKELEDDDKVGNVLDSFFTNFGGYLGGNIHGRQLNVVASPPKAAASTFEKDKEMSKNKFDKLTSYFSGLKGRGRKLYVVASAPITEELSQSEFDKFFSYIHKLQAHNRKLYVVAANPTEVKAAVPTTEELSQSEFGKFSKYIHILKSYRRKLYTIPPVGINMAGEKVKGSFLDFLNGFGGKGHFDAAGKIKVAGKDGFKSLNRAHKNHFASKEA